MDLVNTASPRSRRVAAGRGPATELVFDPEVDADRPGRQVYHFMDSLPTVPLVARTDPRFDPEVDSDRGFVAPTIVVIDAVMRDDSRFNPETDADRGS